MRSHWYSDCDGHDTSVLATPQESRSLVYQALNHADRHLRGVFADDWDFDVDSLDLEDRSATRSNFLYLFYSNFEHFKQFS